MLRRLIFLVIYTAIGEIFFPNLSKTINLMKQNLISLGWGVGYNFKTRTTWYLLWQL